MVGRGARPVLALRPACRPWLTSAAHRGL